MDSIPEIKYLKSFVYYILIALIAGIIIGAIQGAILGFVLGASGVDLRTIPIICGITGSVFGLFASFFVFRWIIKTQIIPQITKHYGHVLISSDSIPQTSCEAASGHPDQYSNRIWQPTVPLSSTEVANIVEAYSMKSLGIKEHQKNLSILEELRVAPGNLENLFDDLEDIHQIYTSPEIRRRIRSISDIVRLVQRKENEDSEQDETQQPSLAALSSTSPVT